VTGFSYDAAITAFHRLLLEDGVVPDVIMVGAEMKAYKVVFSPYVPAFDDETMERMKRFVENGGTWVLGPLSTCRTVEATAHRDACYGADLEKWLGVHVRHRLPPGGATKLAVGGESIGCHWWCDAYEPLAGQTVLAKYSGGPLDGFAAIVECHIDKGRVILLGTQPDTAWLAKWIQQIMPAPAVPAAKGIIVVERVSNNGKPAGVIAINTMREAAELKLAGIQSQMVDGYAVTIKPLKDN
jgi:beta-galactosidase